jgi:hypothetical protein
MRQLQASVLATVGAIDAIKMSQEDILRLRTLESEMSFKYAVSTDGKKKKMVRAAL